MKGKLARRLRGRKLAALLLLIPLAAACSAGRDETGKSNVIDPPPASVEQSMLEKAGDAADQNAASDSGTTKESVTVYLQDTKGYLAPMTLRLGEAGESAAESVQSSAETALAWLTEDPRRADHLPEGFAAILPEGAKVDSVTMDTEQGTLSIDFADPFPGLPADKERKMLEAVVWSMTELPGIDKVKLSVAGQPLRMLPASGLPVDDVLTRGIGINVEQAQGVQISRSMAVTLYFSARSASGDGYFVPVTRLIARTPDRMRAALDELIKGPQGTPDLQSAFMPGVTVENMEKMSDTVNVSLRNKDWEPAAAVPSAMMEALILTVTEAAGAPQVKVAMNGNDTFLDSDLRPYDRPVIRPVAVNTLER